MNQEVQKSSRTSVPGIFGTLNPQKIVILILRNWYIYVLALIIAFAAGVLYLKYKLPSYIASTTILVEEEEGMPGEDLLQGFAVRPGIQNLDNQLVIVTSHSLIKKVVDELPFEIDVYKKGLFSKASYFPMSPLRLEPGPNGLPYGVKICVQFCGK